MSTISTTPRPGWAFVTLRIERHGPRRYMRADTYMRWVDPLDYDPENRMVGVIAADALTDYDWKNRYADASRPLRELREGRDRAGDLTVVADVEIRVDGDLILECDLADALDVLEAWDDRRHPDRPYRPQGIPA